MISCHIIQSNSFGHQFKETSACIDVAITNMKKAVFIFNKMNLDGVLVSRDYLLKKSFESSSTAEPDEVKYRRLSLTSTSICLDIFCLTCTITNKSLE